MQQRSARLPETQRMPFPSAPPAGCPAGWQPAWLSAPAAAWARPQPQSPAGASTLGWGRPAGAGRAPTCRLSSKLVRPPPLLPPPSHQPWARQAPPHLQVVQQLEKLLLVGQRLLARRTRRHQRAGLAPQPLDLAAQRLVGLPARRRCDSGQRRGVRMVGRVQAKVGRASAARSAEMAREGWPDPAGGLRATMCLPTPGSSTERYAGRCPPPAPPFPAPRPVASRLPTASRRSVSALTPAARASNSAACLPSSSSHLASSPVMK